MALNTSREWLYKKPWDIPEFPSRRDTEEATALETKKEWQMVYFWCPFELKKESQEAGITNLV